MRQRSQAHAKILRDFHGTIGAGRLSGSRETAVIAVVLLGLSSTAAHAQVASRVSAQAYPSRPIRFVIPFGPGSATDVLARIAGQNANSAAAKIGLMANGCVRIKNAVNSI